MNDNLVENFMKYNIITVLETESLKQVIETIFSNNIKTIPIVNNKGILVGVFDYTKSFSQLLRYIETKSDKCMMNVEISNFMNKEMIIGHPADCIYSTYNKMIETKSEYLIIIENEINIGIINIYELFNSLYKSKALNTESELNTIESSCKQLTKDNQIEYLEEKLKILYSETITDPLTGLFNIRYFNRRIEGEVERVNRYKEKMSILFIDLDCFKKVNDTYGHEFGNIVLARISRLLKNSENSPDYILRKSDIAVRYGGEEFVIILPSTSKEQASNLAERVRMSVENTNIPYRNEVINVTVSIGVSEFSEGSKSISESIKQADEAMYQAKTNGRNCIVVV